MPKFRVFRIFRVFRAAFGLELKTSSSSSFYSQPSWPILLTPHLKLDVLHFNTNLAFPNIDDEIIERFPDIGDREFYLLVNRTLEESRAVSRAESLLDQ